MKSLARLAGLGLVRLAANPQVRNFNGTENPSAEGPGYGAGSASSD